MTSIRYTLLESISHILLGFMQKVSAPSRGACVIKKLYIFPFSPRRHNRTRLKNAFVHAKRFYAAGIYLLLLSHARRRSANIRKSARRLSAIITTPTDWERRAKAKRMSHCMRVVNNIVEQMQIKSWLNGVLKGNGVVPKVFIKLTRQPGAVAWIKCSAALLTGSAILLFSEIYKWKYSGIYFILRLCGGDV